MPVDVLTATEIARPKPEVAAFAANPDNAPLWYVNIKSAEWKSEPILRVGSKVAFVAQFLGRRLAYTYEIVEFAPGKRLVMRTAEGPFPMETIYTWETTADGGTRMTLRNRGAPSGFSRFLAPFMAAAMRRANRKDLAALKSLLERPAR
jgi:Polyketide cyclase / dehydrase and lipid transport